jgi:hypothetical protein
MSHWAIRLPMEPSADPAPTNNDLANVLQGLVQQNRDLEQRLQQQMQAHKDESRDAKETLLRQMEVFDVEQKQTKGEEGAASTASEPMAANSVEECEREVDHAPLARHGIAFLGISPYKVESIFLCNCVPLSGSGTSLTFMPALIKSFKLPGTPFLRIAQQRVKLILYQG